MFYLTPQERFALACLLTVLTVGILISVGLKKDAKVLRWVQVAGPMRNIGPVDLNKASLTQLEKLPGIGLKMAGRILDYRRTHGCFTSPQELKKIKGISKRSYALLEDEVMSSPCVQAMRNLQ